MTECNLNDGTNPSVDIGGALGGRSRAAVLKQNLSQECSSRLGYYTRTHENLWMEECIVSGYLAKCRYNYETKNTIRSLKINLLFNSAHRVWPTRSLAAYTLYLYRYCWHVEVAALHWPPERQSATPERSCGAILYLFHWL